MRIFVLIVGCLMLFVSSGIEIVYATPSITSTIMVKMVKGLTAAEQAAIIARNGGVEISSVPVLRLHVISVPAENLFLLLKDYRADPQVESVEVSKSRKAETLSDDQHVGVQWSLQKIGWDKVYGKIAPKGTATVALLDTGIDATHPDLKNNIVVGTSILDGSNGFTDPSGHGTQMAGIIAAVTGNGKGIAGVAYAGVKVMPITVLDAAGIGQDTDIIQGIVWAVDHGANILLMAFSNHDFSQNLQDALDYAWSKGTVLVAATGNNATSTPTYPAGNRGVIGISATDETDLLAATSNFGLDTFLAAPGTNIYTTTLGNTYNYVSGTSASSAIVAGVAGFMKANDSKLSNGAIVGRLAKSADSVGSASNLNNQTMYGNGRVDMAKAIADTSTNIIVQPAGTLGGGGPYVGPYKAAAMKTATVTGNWNSTTTWGGAAVPVTGDTVVINSGVKVTVNVNTASVASIKINAPASSNGITVSGTNTLNCSGTIAMNAPTASANGTIAVGTGTLNAGSITITGGSSSSQYSLVSLSTGTINVTGDISFSGMQAQARLAFTGSGTLNIGGNLGANGTFTASTGTVNFRGGHNQSVAGYTYNTLKANSCFNVNLAGAATIKTLTIGDATVCQCNPSPCVINMPTFFYDNGFSITLSSGSALNFISGDYYISSSTLPNFSLKNINFKTSWFIYTGVGPQTVASVNNSMNVALSGSGVKSFAPGVTLNTLDINLGATAYITPGLNLQVGALVFGITSGQQGTIKGTWGSTTATAATHHNNTYFAPSTGYLTVLSDMRSAQPTVTLSVVFGGPNTVKVGNTFIAVASGGRGTGAYAYSATGSACQVNASTGVGKVLHVSGGCSVTATKAGDDYNSMSSPSAPLIITTINKGDQAALILNTTMPLANAQSETMSVTGGTTGGAATYKLVSGPCSITGNKLTAKSNTGYCLVNATMAGNTDYNPVTSYPDNFVVLK